MTQTRAKAAGGGSRLLALALIALAAFGAYLSASGLDLGRSVFDMGFGFGPVTQSIVELDRFGARDPNYGWWSYAIRMPFIPVCAALSTVISLKLTALFIIKNGLSWSAWIYALLRLRRYYSIPGKWALLAAALVLIVPYNMSMGNQIENEEGYLLAPIALLFVLLLTGRTVLSYLTIGALIVSVYLTKSSMLFVCLVAAVWAGISAWKINRFMAIIPTLALALAITSWGAYISAHTGVFAAGADASSWNGRNFYKGNNPFAYSFYPRLSLDLLDEQLLPSTPVHNEWDLNRAQFALGWKYARAHPDTTLKLDSKKLFVACCDLKESPERTPGHTRIMVIVSSLFNHLVLDAVLLYAIRNALQGNLSDAEMLLILFCVAYLTPYFAGFLYMRHMVPIYGLAAFTGSIQIANWQKRGASATLQRG
jgi:hypothetical protein